MALQLEEINPETDFPELARCLLEAYEDPLQRFLHILLPVHGPGPEAREAAIKEAGERLQTWHSLDPTNYWQKMVDVDSGKIIGGASWHIHKTNPFEDAHPMEATWFPEDSSRVYAEKALENFGRPRFEVAQRPHLYLFNVFVHPEFRRRGVGQQFLDWGMNKADELGLEFFLDATPPGKPLYEANGFVVVEENVTAPTTDNPDEKWREMEKKVGPFTFWLMWRPCGGRYEEGKTVKPWENN